MSAAFPSINSAIIPRWSRGSIQERKKNHFDYFEGRRRRREGIRKIRERERKENRRVILLELRNEGERGGREGVILGETVPFGLSDIGKSLGLEAITKAVTKLSEWLNFRTGKRSLDAFSIVHRRPRDGNSIIIRQLGLMLEADGTTFRFYGLVPATGTINFPAVDTYARFHVPSCVQRGEEGRRSFPFHSFPSREKGIATRRWLLTCGLVTLLACSWKDIPAEITRGGSGFQENINGWNVAKSNSSGYRYVL